jgi:hypothetical protein
LAVDEHAVGATLPDGLEALRRELKLGEVMSLIERTARWVDPETFGVLPVWYPEHARGAYFYKNNWSQPLTNKNRETGREEHKREANSYANKALTKALGLRSIDRTNWSCCHIWGVDDARFQESNLIVRHHSFYSCVANMVLLPTPLKAFTDAMLEVKAMLRICARNLYGWQCDHESAAAAVEIIDRWNDWNDYPKSWPRTSANCLPLGVMKFNTTIKRSAERRLERIRSDLANAGPHYPRDIVKRVLTNWKIPT